MKGNDGSGNIEERDDWKTPKWLFDSINKQYNFTFDCCATEGNSKCEEYSSDFKEIRMTNKNSWMNPPFSKAAEMFEHFFKAIPWGVAIYRCDNMETRLWQNQIFPNASWIFLPNKRIRYEGMEGKGSRFPSALIGLNVPEPKGLRGTILKGRCV